MKALLSHAAREALHIVLSMYGDNEHDKGPEGLQGEFLASLNNMTNKLDSLQKNLHPIYFEFTHIQTYILCTAIGIYTDDPDLFEDEDPAKEASLLAALNQLHGALNIELPLRLPPSIRAIVSRDLAATARTSDFIASTGSDVADSIQYFALRTLPTATDINPLHRAILQFHPICTEAVIFNIPSFNDYYVINA